MMWDKERPVHVASNLHLTEFVVEQTWCSDLLIPPSFDRGGLGKYLTVTFKGPKLFSYKTLLHYLNLYSNFL